MLRFLILCAMIAVASPSLAASQSPFNAVLTVNGDVITAYEIDQRVRFMQALNQSGDLQAEARSALIDERLQMAASKAAGVTVNEEDVTSEMEAFVQRGGVDMEAFRQAFDQYGVDMETFRDFVRTGLAWRALIGEKFAQRVSISDDEIDRALTLTKTGGLRVLLSELVIPIQPGAEAETESFAWELAQSIRSQTDFERAVRRYSAAPTREQAGRLDWMEVQALPQVVQQAVLSMSPGKVSEPINIQGQAIAVFYLRNIAEAPVSGPDIAALDYMLVRLPADGGRERARTMASRAQVCTDLFGQADDLPQDRVQRETRAPADIPARIRDELALLDPGETSTRLTSPDGSEVWLLMLCGRSAVIPEGETREDISRRLRVQRINALADAYLAEIRAAAQIESR